MNDNSSTAASWNVTSHLIWKTKIGCIAPLPAPVVVVWPMLPQLHLALEQQVRALRYVPGEGQAGTLYCTWGGAIRYYVLYLGKFCQILGNVPVYHDQYCAGYWSGD